MPGQLDAVIVRGSLSRFYTSKLLIAMYRPDLCDLPEVAQRIGNRPEA
jgi:hypothetical protein